MDTLESTCVIIMLIICLLSSFKAGKYFVKGEILKAIYYEILWLGMLIIVILGRL